MSNEHTESPYAQNSQPQRCYEPLIQDFELQALLPGMELGGKYRLEEPAVRGKRGQVWRACDLTLNQTVALKFLPPEVRHQERAIEATRMAVQAVRALCYPSICPVYALEIDPRFGCYTVLKWLDGYTLREFLDEKRKFRLPISVETVLEILQCTAQTLDYAHKYQVIHGNVQPQKVFLKLEGGKVQEQFLMDFGSRTESGLPYLAPEYWRGEQLGVASDQFSLAVMAYEMFSGYLPFPKEEPQKCVSEALKPFEPLAFSVATTLNDAVRSRLFEVLCVALSPFPGTRYPSCEAFVDMIKSILEQGAQSTPVMDSTSNMDSAPVVDSVPKSIATPVPPPISTPVQPAIENGLADLDFTTLPKKKTTEKKNVRETKPLDGDLVDIFEGEPVSATPAVSESSKIYPSFEANPVQMPPVLPPTLPTLPTLPTPPIPPTLPTPPELPVLATSQKKYAPGTVMGKGIVVRGKDEKNKQAKKKSGLRVVVGVAVVVLLVAGGVAGWFATQGKLFSKKVETSVTSVPDGAVSVPQQVEQGGESLGKTVSSETVIGTKNETAEAFQSPDFSMIRLYLERKEYDKAQALLSAGKGMKLTPEDASHLKRLEDALRLVKNYHESLKYILTHWEPPMELCDGQFALVEASLERVVIRVNGQNVHFTQSKPQQGENNLYEILYRHRSAKAIKAGNMQPTLEYAVFLLLSPDVDRQKVQPLLKIVEEKGSPTDRETVLGFKAEFGL